MLAITFPGQGSQRPGMGASWVDHPAWTRVEQATAATGKDVARLLLEADAAELTETQNAQLATFVLSAVVYEAALAQGAKPSVVAGHSLGEFTALFAAGVLSFDEACRLVVERGEAMKGAASQRAGTMYAVLGLADDAVDAACRRADGDVWVANYNSDGQVVISGAPNALERAGVIAKELGAKRAKPIPVGGAFHTPFMAPARDRLREAIARTTFKTSTMPIVANVDGRAHGDDANWPELCSAQLCSPVRWKQSTEQLMELGVTTLVELGPGSVLTGLAKRNAPDSNYLSVSEPAHLEALTEALSRMDEARAVAESYAALEQSGAAAEGPLGEQLDIPDRLVVSTVTGLYYPNDSDKGIGDVVAVGEPIVKIGDVDITTPFDGRLMKIMAISGERIKVGQPIAWLAPA